MVHSIRWLYDPKSDEWSGVINGHLWRLRQQDDCERVSYHRDCLFPRTSSAPRQITQYPVDLVDYFRLDTDLESLLAKWMAIDSKFAGGSLRRVESTDDDNHLNYFAAARIRLLRQNPLETVFAFITSACNNVPRISALLVRLSQRFGRRLVSTDGTVVQWDCPSLEALCGTGVERELREMGFGYRAKLIQ